MLEDLDANLINCIDSLREMTTDNHLEDEWREQPCHVTSLHVPT